MAHELDFPGLPAGLTATARGRRLGGTETFGGVALAEAAGVPGVYRGDLPAGLAAGVWRVVVAAGGVDYAHDDVAVGAGGVWAQAPRSGAATYGRLLEAAAAVLAGTWTVDADGREVFRDTTGADRVRVTVDDQKRRAIVELVG